MQYRDKLSEKVLPIDKILDILGKENLSEDIKGALIEYPYMTNWAIRNINSPVEHNKKVANDLICEKAKKALTNKELAQILDSAGNNPLSQEVYEAIITNKSVDVKIIKRLQKLNLEELPKIETHVNCYIQSLKLQKHLKDLNAFIMEDPQIPSTQKKAVQQLYEIINKENEKLTKPDKLITANDIETFKNTCERAIGEHMPTLKKDPGIWHRIRPILRAIVGVIAAITIIAALAVQLGTKRGYVNTFFNSQEKKDVKKLRGLGEGLEKKSKKLLHQRNLKLVLY